MSRRKREAVACAAAKTNTGKGAGWKRFTNARQIWIAAVALLLLGLGAAGAFSGKYKQSFAPQNEASINAAIQPQQTVTNRSLLSKEYVYAGGRMLAVEDAANSISGTTPYGTTQANQAAKFVPDVLITAVLGASSITTTTDSSGYYLLSNLTVGGSYTVIPSKSGYTSGGNSGITSFDATLVLRCVAAGQACLLTPNEKIAADTNKDGAITSFDATLILRYVAANGQTAYTGYVGNWEFVPGERNYSPFPGALAGENYTAIIIGEINGSWTPPPGSVPAPAEVQQQQETEKADILAQAKNLSTKVADGAIPIVSTAEQQQPQQPGTEGAMQISLPENAAAAQGSTITIPVTLTNNTGTQLSAFSFDVQFNPAFLRPAGAEAISTTGTVSAGDCEVVENTVTPGRVVIAGACRNNITAAAGTLVKLRFTVVGHPSNAAPEARALKFWLTYFEDSTGRRIAVGRTNGSIR